MKKVITLAAVLATALSAGSVFAQGGAVELNNAQMNEVSAGWGKRARRAPSFGYNNKADASSVAFAKGRNTRTNTQTFAESGKGYSSSGSKAHASSRGSAGRKH